MRDFNRGGSSRDGGFRRPSSGGFGRPSSGGFGRDSRGGDREMFDAVCDECGKNCKVPFRPTGGKPIFCSECFEQRGGGERDRSNDRGSERRDDSRGDFKAKSSCDYGSKIDALSTKLDKVLEMLNSMKSGKSKVEAKVEKIEIDEEDEDVVVFKKASKVKEEKVEKKAPAKKAVKKASKK